MGQLYDVVSRAANAPAGTDWGLDEVGLTSREEAIAHLVMRMMRWDEGGAVVFVERLLDGAVDPEVPYLVESSDVLWEGPAGVCAGVWFCVRLSGATPPEPFGG